MGKPIIKGETVIIIAICRESAWNRDRQKYIGRKVKLISIENSTFRKGWKFVRFPSPETGYAIMMRVKVRRVKE
ncbi:hypothetical protein LCGC14_0395620 [marine sediment metagenome]|uniref:Uncharacterized protein n=1 Tax=marine sediment metagenome TaxID=412755 RepID=A0A0F9VKF9_9ZZZZ